MNFFNIVNELKQDIDALITAHPELDDDETLRLDCLTGETDIEGLLTKLLDAANDARTMACAVKARRTELGLRQDRFELKEEKLRGLILNILERAGLPKVQLTEATLSIRHIPPAPIIIDEALLPEDCIRIKREFDMNAIKDAVKAGRQVLGTEMSNGKTSLAVRTK